MKTNQHAYAAHEALDTDGVPCLKLVRVGRNNRGADLSEPCLVYDFWRRVVSRRSWFDEDRECSVALLLDKKLNLIAWNLISVGTVESCFLDVAGVFRCAVACSASSVIIAHNHPTGSSEPSSHDLKSTKHLVWAGEFLQVQVEDHLVIGAKGYCSLREDYPEAFPVFGESSKLAADREGASYAKA